MTTLSQERPTSNLNNCSHCVLAETGPFLDLRRIAVSSVWLAVLFQQEGGAHTKRLPVLGIRLSYTRSHPTRAWGFWLALDVPLPVFSWYLASRGPPLRRLASGSFLGLSKVYPCMCAQDGAHRHSQQISINRTLIGSNKGPDAIGQCSAPLQYILLGQIYVAFPAEDVVQHLSRKAKVLSPNNNFELFSGQGPGATVLALR